MKRCVHLVRMSQDPRRIIHYIQAGRAECLTMGDVDLPWRQWFDTSECNRVIGEDTRLGWTQGRRDSCDTEL